MIRRRRLESGGEAGAASDDQRSLGQQASASSSSPRCEGGNSLPSSSSRPQSPARVWKKPLNLSIDSSQASLDLSPAFSAEDGLDEGVVREDSFFESVLPGASAEKGMALVRFGDSIRLWTRSPYFVDPKAVGDFVGAFSKQSQRRSLMGREMLAVVGGAGLPEGSFFEQDFEVVDPHRLHNPGDMVHYGETVVLVSSHGNVWNRKTRGLTGYLDMKPRGIKGELWVSFRQAGSVPAQSPPSRRLAAMRSLSSFASPMMRQTSADSVDSSTEPQVPVRYADSDITIMIENRGGGSVPMNAFKKESSSSACGYLCCSGKGRALTFTVHRSKARILRVIVLEEARRLKAGHRFQPETVHSGINWGDDITFNLSRGQLASAQPLLTECGSPDAPKPDWFSPVAARILLSAGVEARVSVLDIIRQCGQSSPSVLSLPVDAGVEPGAVVVSLSVEFPGGGEAWSWVRCLNWISWPFAMAGFFAVVPVEVTEPRTVFLLGIALLCTALIVRTIRSRSHPCWRDASSVKATLKFVAWQHALGGNEEEPISAFIDLPGTDLPAMPRRFLIAEKENFSKAQARWQSTLAWRDEFGADFVLDRPHPNFEAIKSVYHHGFHGEDRHGHVVYYELPGLLDFDALRALGLTRQDLLAHHTYVMEYCWRVLKTAESDKMTVVIDCAGVRFRDMGGEAAQFLKATVGVLSSHYPQRSCTIFVLNAPDFFSMAYALVKPLLNRTTREKIQVLAPSQQTAALLQTIPEESLPKKYGGSSQFELGHSPQELLLKKFVQDKRNRKDFEDDKDYPGKKAPAAS